MAKVTAEFAWGTMTIVVPDDDYWVLKQKARAGDKDTQIKLAALTGNPKFLPRNPDEFKGNDEVTNVEK